jgi:hypothetical protein
MQTPTSGHHMHRPVIREHTQAGGAPAVGRFAQPLRERRIGAAKPEHGFRRALDRHGLESKGPMRLNAPS